VTTDPEGGTAVRAGRYISENVYSDVTVSKGRTELRLNLDLGPGVTARGSAASDGETGIGLFFERDY
jgi:translocation and assembly module TamB